MQPPQTVPEHMLRDLAPRVLGIVARQTRDFATAEDAVQEALIAASLHWPMGGIPDNPCAWLIRVALRRVVDYERNAASRRRREQSTQLDAPLTTPPADEERADEDDTLELFFMCAHPALTPASAVALTLRAVGGLTTGEIARAFMVPEKTMGQRIARAKASIKELGLSVDGNAGIDAQERIRSVLHVLYLIFNEGYTSTSGPNLQRLDLSVEAVRLTRMLRGLRPHDGDVAGLLALMLLTDARRAARTDATGALVPLAEQDRSLWDRAAVAEGTALLEESFARGSIGTYQLLAAIGALHDEAERAEETDWPQIVALYDVLMRITDNPMVVLNHAIALAMVSGPQKGLERLEQLEGDARLASHHRLDAARAHLLEMAGNLDEAAVYYRRAAERTTSIPERNYLIMRAARLR